MNLNLSAAFYLVAISSTLFGGAMWLTSIDNRASASMAGVQYLQAHVDNNQKAFEEIRTRLTRIEDAVGVKARRPSDGE